MPDNVVPLGVGTSEKDIDALVEKLKHLKKKHADENPKIWIYNNGVKDAHFHMEELDNGHFRIHYRTRMITDVNTEKEWRDICMQENKTYNDTVTRLIFQPDNFRKNSDDYCYDPRVETQWNHNTNVLVLIKYEPHTETFANLRECARGLPRIWALNIMSTDKWIWYDGSIHDGPPDSDVEDKDYNRLPTWVTPSVLPTYTDEGVDPIVFTKHMTYILDKKLKEINRKIDTLFDMMGAVPGGDAYLVAKEHFEGETPPNPLTP